MSDNTGDILKVMIARIKSQVTALSNRVYTIIPQNTNFPYAFLRFEAVDTSTKTNDAREIYLNISIYAQEATTAGAMEQVLSIGKSIYTALIDYAPSIDDGEITYCRNDGLQIVNQEDDGKTMQYVIRFKILTTSERG